MISNFKPYPLTIIAVHFETIMVFKTLNSIKRELCPGKQFHRLRKYYSKPELLFQNSKPDPLTKITLCIEKS